jgi:hypothetical protein
MSINNYWFDTGWQALLYKLHEEMESERAVYEKLADEQELEGGKLDEFFSYHRGLEDKKASDPTDAD